MNRILYLLSVLILTGSCASEKYLPKPGEFGLSPYGALIRVHTIHNSLHGELLALNDKNLVIRTDMKPYLRYVDTTTVTSYSIQYCKSRRFGILPLISVSHGLFMVFTVPLNSLAAGIMRSKEIKDTRYRNLPFSEAAFYARYPEGMPESYTVEGE